jgi:CNT family concentrative nucleoside transporter
VVVACAYVFADRIGPKGRAVCGLLAFLLVVASLSSDLRKVRLRVLLWGFALQFGLAWLILKFRVEPFTLNLGLFHWQSQGRPFYELIQAIAGAIQTFLKFSDAGAEFVFGPLAKDEPMNKAFGQSFVFAFRALPPIIFVSSFFTVLYHFGVLQFIVRWLARGMMYLMGTSGAETFSSAANVFMGQTEAPLIVKPYVPKMTISELLALMVGGMATISGGVMAVYIMLGADPVAILATSVMAAPCGLYLSKLMIPETEVPETSGTSDVPYERLHRNAIDAASAGASDGLKLALNVAAMLIAFLAFIALFNHLLGLINTVKFNEKMADWGIHFLLPEKVSLQWIFGKLFSPVAFLMGVDRADIDAVGSLLGTKLAANEFVAYLQLVEPEVKNAISRRSFQLAVFALTGFANFSSIGIQIGGIGAMAPERRADLARLGLRALFVGFLATLVNASLAGILMD